MKRQGPLVLGCFLVGVVIRGPRLYGDYFISHEKDPVIKQPGFNGKHVSDVSTHLKKHGVKGATPEWQRWLFFCFEMLNMGQLKCMHSYLHVPLEASRRLGSVGYNPNISNL